MIICHCQTITDRDINSAIDWMRAADPDVLITPGKIYRALGKSADCGGCLPLFLAQMQANPSFPVPGMAFPDRSDRINRRKRIRSGPGAGTRKEAP